MRPSSRTRSCLPSRVSQPPEQQAEQGVLALGDNGPRAQQVAARERGPGPTAADHFAALCDSRPSPLLVAAVIEYATGTKLTPLTSRVQHGLKMRGPAASYKPPRTGADLSTRATTSLRRTKAQRANDANPPSSRTRLVVAGSSKRVRLRAVSNGQIGGHVRAGARDRFHLSPTAELTSAWATKHSSGFRRSRHRNAYRSPTGRHAQRVIALAYLALLLGGTRGRRSRVSGPPFAFGPG